MPCDATNVNYIVTTNNVIYIVSYTDVIYTEICSANYTVNYKVN